MRWRMGKSACQMYTAHCERCKSSNGKQDCCQLQWLGKKIFLKIEIRFKDGFDIKGNDLA